MLREQVQYHFLPIQFDSNNGEYSQTNEITDYLNFIPALNNSSTTINSNDNCAKFQSATISDEGSISGKFVYEKWLKGIGIYEPFEFVCLRFQKANDSNFLEWLGCLLPRGRTFEEIVSDCLKLILKLNFKKAEVIDWLNHLPVLEKWINISEQLGYEIFTCGTCSNSIDALIQSVDEDILLLQNQYKKSVQNLLDMSLFLKSKFPSSTLMIDHIIELQTFSDTMIGFKKVKLNKFSQCECIPQNFNSDHRTMLMNIVGKYLPSVKQCNNTVDRLLSIPENDCITLGQLFRNTPSCSRTSEENKLRLVEELFNSNLFEIERPKFKSLFLRKRF